MKGKLLNTLEESMYFALKKANYSAVVANSEVLIKLMSTKT